MSLTYIDLNKIERRKIEESYDKLTPKLLWQFCGKYHEKYCIILIGYER